MFCSLKTFMANVSFFLLLFSTFHLQQVSAVCGCIQDNGGYYEHAAWGGNGGWWGGGNRDWLGDYDEWPGSQNHFRNCRLNCYNRACSYHHRYCDRCRTGYYAPNCQYTYDDSVPGAGLYWDLNCSR